MNHTCAVSPGVFELAPPASRWSVAQGGSLRADRSGALAFTVSGADEPTLVVTTLTGRGQLLGVLDALADGHSVTSALRKSSIPRCDWNFAVRLLRRLASAGYLVPAAGPTTETCGCTTLDTTKDEARSDV